MTSGSAGINSINLPTFQKRFGLGFILAMAIAMFMLSSCENDLKKIKEISAKYNSSPAEQTTGVEIIYSDSAHVKAKVEAPVMLKIKVKKTRYEMPKGIKITFYDENLAVISVITSDYAIYQIDDKRFELDKNVVATNQKGDIFRSEQLIWDETTRKVTSAKPVTITTSNGSVIHGASLITNEKFDPWDIVNTNGVFHVDQNLSQQQP